VKLLLYYIFPFILLLNNNDVHKQYTAIRAPVMSRIELKLFSENIFLRVYVMQCNQILAV